jgi:hypothetical protein
MTDEPLTKADRYPPTIWSKLREGLLVDLILIGLVVTVAGLIDESQAVVTGGCIATAVAIAGFPPVLFLEYRADMKHDREHPEVQA